MTGMSAFTSHIQHSTGCSSHHSYARERNKKHPNLKGISKFLIICRSHDIKTLKTPPKTFRANNISVRLQYKRKYTEICGISPY